MNENSANLKHKNHGAGLSIPIQPLQRPTGPCEMRTVHVLHNIADCPGARRVIDGVFIGGDCESYAGRPGVVMREFRGYASWFPGQLEGEIHNGHGWTHSNEVSTDDVFNPDPMWLFESF
jgi:putative AlgH/UPF0301 family transcriptional regulator